MSARGCIRRISSRAGARQENGDTIMPNANTDVEMTETTGAERADRDARETMLLLPAPECANAENELEIGPDKDTPLAAFPQYEINEELARTAPPMLPEELELIEADMKAGRRVRGEIAIWRGKVVYGDMLYRLAKKHRIPFEPVVVEAEDEEDVKEYIIRSLLARKHLSKWWRVVLALVLKDILRAKGLRNQAWRGDNFLMNLSGQRPLNTRAIIAKLAAVSEGIVSDVEKILAAFESGRIPPTIRRKLETGERSISSVVKDLQRPGDNGNGSASQEGSGDGGDGAAQSPPSTGMTPEQQQALENARRFPVNEVLDKFATVFQRLYDELKGDNNAERGKRALLVQMFRLGKKLARSGLKVDQFYHASLDAIDRERRAGR